MQIIYMQVQFCYCKIQWLHFAKQNISALVAAPSFLFAPLHMRSGFKQLTINSVYVGHLLKVSCDVRVSRLVQKKPHKVNKISNVVVLSGQNPRFQVKFNPAKLVMAVLFS